MFQSPRSGKFVSDRKYWAFYQSYIKAFQSPRSGKFVSDVKIFGAGNGTKLMRFQSPRSGKFVSDQTDRPSDRHTVSVSIP